MSVTVSRRTFLVGTALAATLPRPARAQGKPVKIGPSMSPPRGPVVPRPFAAT